MARVFLVSAPGALATARHPVGGGVRILEMLADALAARHEVAVVTAGAHDTDVCANGIRRVQLAVPSLADGPEARLLDFNEFAYARFSIEFEQRATRFILDINRAGAVAICNDIAEGPDFEALAQAGLPTITLFHVVVADFFSRIYLRNILRPAQFVGLLAWMKRRHLYGLVPRIARLVFKEAPAVRHSAALVVPSRGMGEALAVAFPAVDPRKIRVVPWGIEPSAIDAAEAERLAGALRQEYGIDEQTRVLMTMSRLSREKGLELLLDALARLDGDSGPPLIALLCGQGAYMGGAEYVKRLERQARRLRRIRVVFPGYLAGARKAAHFRLAHLFVNTSKYEAYGLAIAEAMQAGLPVLASAHYGSRDLVRAPHGEIVEGRDPAVFAERLARWLDNPARRAEAGQAARETGASLDFTQAAAAIEAMVREAARV